MLAQVNEDDDEEAYRKVMVASGGKREGEWKDTDVSQKIRGRRVTGAVSPAMLAQVNEDDDDEEEAYRKVMVASGGRREGEWKDTDVSQKIRARPKTGKVPPAMLAQVDDDEEEAYRK